MTTLLKQRYDGDEQRKDCFLCAAAMACGLTYEAAWDRLDEDIQASLKEKGAFGDQCDRILQALGHTRLIIAARHGSASDKPGSYLMLYVSLDYASVGFTKNMLWGRRALIQVRSKNYRDESHITYWDGHEFFDPSNAKVYTWNEVEPTYIWLFDERPRD